MTTSFTYRIANLALALAIFLPVAMVVINQAAQIVA